MLLPNCSMRKGAEVLRKCWHALVPADIVLGYQWSIYTPIDVEYLTNWNNQWIRGHLIVGDLRLLLMLKPPVYPVLVMPEGDTWIGRLDGC